MLHVGARVTVKGLKSRPDLNGGDASIVAWVQSSRRWQIRTRSGEDVAVKPECLDTDITVPPHCPCLWRLPAPPSDPIKLVRTLHTVLGKVAFNASSLGQAFVDGGGVDAVIKIAFGGWPKTGLATSRHWADKVVEVGPRVYHSARRVALSALADMVADGEPYVSALVGNTLFSETFSMAATSLMENYRWRQPFQSNYCPHDHDQQQCMAERIVNIANCTLFCWAETCREGANSDAKIVAAVAALILPILHAIPSPVPSRFEFDSPSERKRAAKALRAARAFDLDRLIPRPFTPEMYAMAGLHGFVMPSSRDYPIAAPHEPLENDNDYMADGVGRMLNAVLVRAMRRNPDKPIDAPWMAPVLAAGASRKLVDLMAPFASKVTPDMARRDQAVHALLFFSQCSAGTGAANPTSKPDKAATVPRAKTDGSDDGSGFTARAKTQGSCFECKAQVPRLKWCAGCHMTGYCSAKCQKAAWANHKKLCLPYTKWEAFVKHVMAVQKEPFLTGPWAGKMPADVQMDPNTPTYSKRQLSLQEYIMMLAVSEKRFSTSADRRAATDGADGVSMYGVVTWMRAGVVAAVYAHGPSLKLCDHAMCDHCCVVWRQTLDARVCQMCEKPVANLSFLSGVTSVGPVGHCTVGPPTTPVWLRKVQPDARSGEPRLHLSELETCSEKCKKALLAVLAKAPTISSNDFIDSSDALVKKRDADAEIPMSVEFT